MDAVGKFVENLGGSLVIDLQNSHDADFVPFSIVITVPDIHIRRIATDIFRMPSRKDIDVYSELKVAVV